MFSTSSWFELQENASAESIALDFRGTDDALHIHSLNINARARKREKNNQQQKHTCVMRNAHFRTCFVWCFRIEFYIAKSYIFIKSIFKTSNKNNNVEKRTQRKSNESSARAPKWKENDTKRKTIYISIGNKQIHRWVLMFQYCVLATQAYGMCQYQCQCRFRFPLTVVYLFARVIVLSGWFFFDRSLFLSLSRSLALVRSSSLCCNMFCVS